MLIKKKSQGLLEYTLLLGAIIAIVVVVLMGKNGIGNATKTTYTNAGKAIANTMSKAQNDIGIFNGTATDEGGVNDPMSNGAEG